MDTAFSFVGDVDVVGEENLTPGVAVVVKAVVTVIVPAVLSAARRSVDSVGSFMVRDGMEEDRRRRRRQNFQVEVLNWRL